MRDAPFDRFDRRDEMLTDQETMELLDFLDLHIPAMLQCVRDGKTMYGMPFVNGLLRFLFDDLQRVRAGETSVSGVFERRMLWRQ
jgi:hypothetical protein